MSAFTEDSGIVIEGTTLVRWPVDSAEVVVPEGIEVIGTEAFEPDYFKRNVLHSITLPSTLRRIEDGAFENNIALADVELPMGLEYIGAHAFWNCASLQKVVIPASVTEVGFGSFSGCQKLENVILSGIFAGERDPNILFEKGTVTPGTLPAGLFAGCKALKKISVPEGFTCIGRATFEGCGLEQIELPESLEYLERKAFAKCVALKQLHLGKNVSHLGESVLPIGNMGHLYRSTAALETLEVAPDNPYFRTAENILFSTAGELIFCPSGFSAEEYAIPEDTVSIRSRAFQGNTGIRKLVIPATVQTLGKMAFAEMSELREAVFSGERKELGDELFLASRKLNTVTFPKELESIGVSCFAQTGLKAISIPDTVRALGNYAFSQIPARSVVLPKNVETIGLSVFAGIPDITIYDNLDPKGTPAGQALDPVNGRGSNMIGYLGVQQYSHCEFGACNCQWFDHTITVRSAQTNEVKYSVRIPNGQTQAIDCTFATAWGAHAEFYFPAIDKRFKELTTDAKEDYALTRLEHWDHLSDGFRDTLSKYFTRNANNLFARICAIDDVPLLIRLEPHGIVKKTSIDTRLEQADQANATACKAWLLEWQNKNMSAKQKERKVENSLKLRGPTVADLKKIWPHKKGRDGGILILSYNGEDADIEIPAFIGKTPVTAIAPYCFTRSADADLHDRDFFSKSLRSVVIPDSVHSIGQYAFDFCRVLESVTLPAGLKELQEGLFRGCEKLTVEIPASLERIAEQAFGGVCGINLHPDNSNFHIADGVLFSADGSKLLCYPAGKADECYTIPESVRVIEKMAFSTSNMGLSGNPHLKHLVLHKNLAVIGDCAFAKCTALESVEMPGNPEQMGQTVFGSCTSLKQISLPEGLSTLPRSTFSGCSALKQISLPKSLRKLDAYAFSDCTELEHLIIPQRAISFGGNVFWNCPKLVIHTSENSKTWELAKNQNIPVISE